MGFESDSGTQLRGLGPRMVVLVQLGQGCGVHQGK